MVVIDWLQTFEFVRANSERFILYCLCGCFVGITLILITILIVLYIERRHRPKKNPLQTIDVDDERRIKSDYQIPRADLDYDVLSTTRSYLPVYRYDGRNPNGFYHV